MSKIELFTSKAFPSGAWVISAYIGDDYAGESSYFGYTKAQAMKLARQTVRECGGLGIYKHAKA